MEMPERDDERRARPTGEAEAALAEAFAAARAAAPDRPALPPALAARLSADAHAAQPAPPRALRRRPPAWHAWPEATALAASLAAGVWLGLAPPAPVAGTLAGLQAGLRGETPRVGTAGDLLAPVDAGLIVALHGGEDA
jgi:hypothetical protein